MVDAQCLVAFSDSWMVSQVQKNNPTDSLELGRLHLGVPPMVHATGSDRGAKCRLMNWSLCMLDDGEDGGARGEIRGAHNQVF